MPDINPIVALFRAFARALERLILRTLDSPGPPMQQLEEAEDLAREVTQEAREEIAEWVEGNGPDFYSEGVREAGGSVTPEMEDSRDLAIEELADDLLSATRNMEESAKRTLRKIARRRTEAALAGGTDEIEKFRREIEEEGVTVTDSAGRKQRPEHYARLVLETVGADIKNTGHIDAAAQIGAPGVRVSDGGPGDVDSPCIEANGQRWSLAFARLNKLEHPFCRRSFASLAPGDDAPLDRS